MNRHAPASEIMIEDFRQILAWPFVMSSDQGNGATGSEENWFEERGKELESQDSHWNKKSPRELMKDGSISAYEEENVFHEYINDTLFRENPAIRSFQYESLRKITFQFRRNREGRSKPYNFEIPFNSLQVYNCGVAMLTLELEYVGPRLALDEAQFLIHRLRRANPPFWFGHDAPAHCPLRAVIHEEIPGAEGEKNEPEKSNARSTRESEAGSSGKWMEKPPCELGDLKNRETALRALGEAGFRQLLFSWWLEILAPLSVEGNQEYGGTPSLRQITDARIPALTTISLIDDGRPFEVLRSISDADWFRIAEAIEEGAGSGRPDAEFAKMKLEEYFYDRFMPSASEASEVESAASAARFAFAPHHFAAVVAGGSGEPNFTELVRRHYRHMQHLCLLEFAAVVGISQRLYKAVNRQVSRKTRQYDRKFRGEILVLQEMFMDFTHRHRFTGVSNELKMGEMFARFRKSMKLDSMYKETKEELQSASNLAFAQRQMRIANSSRWLAIIATTATVIGAIAAIIGLAPGFHEDL